MVTYLICLNLDTANIIYSKRWTDQKVYRYNFFQPVGGAVVSGHTQGRVDTAKLKIPEVKQQFQFKLRKRFSCLAQDESKEGNEPDIGTG